MKTFLIFPSGSHYTEITLGDGTPESVYRGICSDYMPATRVAVIDTETGKCGVFSRVLDKSGNLKSIIDFSTRTPKVIR